MNRDRRQTRYVFRPPRYSRFWAPLLVRLSDAFCLRHQYRVVETRVRSGAESLAALHRQGHGLLLAANHSDHADPHVMLHVGRRLGVPLHFVAAREVFERNRGVNGLLLPRVGAFSIDREGADIGAIKESIRILTEGRFPLVIFPEGEVYHLNEQLTPLNDGTAAIALRAARGLSREGNPRRVFIVPAALRYTYLDDVGGALLHTMTRLERHILWRPQTSLTLIERVFRFGEALLGLMEMEYLGYTQTGPLAERLQRFREALIAAAETHCLGRAMAGPHPERVRHLRGRLRAILLADPPPPPATVREVYEELDRLFFAVQLYSYPPDYLAANASPDRLAETLLKFEEDVFGYADIKGRRRAEVTLGKPLDVTALLDRYAADPKECVRALTEDLARGIRGGLGPA